MESTVSPERVGLSPARLERLAPALHRYVDEGKVAGLLTLVARRGGIAHVQCYGERDREAHQPMTEDTIFRIYSMSKPITSLAVLMLYEEGRFLLTDPVAQYIPAFKDTPVFVRETDKGLETEPQARPMTILDLLRHTSGLSYPNPSPEALPVERLMARSEELESKSMPEPTLEQFVEWLAGFPLCWQPGTRWQYGFSVDVLGRLVEIFSGRSFDAFLQERIFGPLGMVDTGFWVPPEKVSRFAAMYGPGEQGGLKLLDPPGGEYAKPKRFLSGGGGLVSTAQDYWRFAQLLLDKGIFRGERLVSRKTVELMTTNHLPDAVLPTFGDPGMGFGLGVCVRMSLGGAAFLGSVGEYGWSGMASTHYRADPKEQMIELFMTQFVPTPEVSYPFHEQFRVLAQQAIDD